MKPGDFDETALEVLLHGALAASGHICSLCNRGWPDHTVPERVACCTELQRQRQLKHGTPF